MTRFARRPCTAWALGRGLGGSSTTGTTGLVAVADCWVGSSAGYGGTTDSPPADELTPSLYPLWAAE